MNKFRAFVQIFGLASLLLLAVYGVFELAGPGALNVFGPGSVRAQENVPVYLAGAIAIPDTINYQGFLREPDGNPTTGAYTITARIYDNATLGNKLFEQTVQNVTVRDGLFNLVLENVEDIFNDIPRYIGIDLNDGAGELIPRQRLHAVPWAMSSTTLVKDASVDGLLVENGLVTSNGLTVTGGLSATGGAELDHLVVGNEAGKNIVMDGENIDARDGAEVSTLYLQQNGGTVDIGGKIQIQSDNKPFFIQRFNLNGNTNYWCFKGGYCKDTLIPTNEYTCFVGGFDYGWGDFQEANRGWLASAFLSDKNGTWNIEAGIRSEDGEGAPDISIYVTCIENGWIDGR